MGKNTQIVFLFPLPLSASLAFGTLTPLKVSSAPFVNKLLRTIWLFELLCCTTHKVVSKNLVSLKSFAEDSKTFTLYNRQSCQNNFVLFVPHAVNCFDLNYGNSAANDLLNVSL